MEISNDEIDFLFSIGASGLKLLGNLFQHNAPLLALHGDGFELAVLEQVFQHLLAVLLFAGGLHVQLLARGADQRKQGLIQNLPVEGGHGVVLLLVHGDQPGFFQLFQMKGNGGGRAFQQLGQQLHVFGAVGKRFHQLQAGGVRQAFEEKNGL